MPKPVATCPRCHRSLDSLAWDVAGSVLCGCGASVWLRPEQRRAISAARMPELPGLSAGWGR